MNTTLTARRVMIYTASVLFVVGLAWLLLKIHSILIILILGIILATAIDPFVQRLRRMGLTRGQAILAVYAALITFFGSIFYLVIPPLVSQAIELVNGIPDILNNLEEQARSSESSFARTTGVRAINRAERAYEEYRASPPVEGATAVGWVVSVIGFIVTIFSVLIVAFYWTTEKATIKRLVLGLFSIEKRDEAHQAWDEIEAKLGGWTRGEAVLMMAVGGVSALAYWLVGLDFWLALGIWAGFTELIPIIGPILGGAAAVTIALTDSWQKALLVVVIVFAIQQLEGAFLVPRVMNNAVGLSPLAVILAVFVGGTLLGIIGAIIAIPIAAAVQVLVQHLLALGAEDDRVLEGLPARSPPLPSVTPAVPTSQGDEEEVRLNPPKGHRPFQRRRAERQ